MIEQVFHLGLFFNTITFFEKGSKFLTSLSLYHKKHLRFYATFEHYALLVATISFVFTTVVIVKSSTKSMGR
jgi:hypothetical protein